VEGRKGVTWAKTNPLGAEAIADVPKADEGSTRAATGQNQEEPQQSPVAEVKKAGKRGKHEVVQTRQSA
jgi:hypothetical protein